jgi:uncharacterized membrane protein
VNRVTVLLAAVVITVPMAAPGALAQGDDGGQATRPAPDDWEPWYDDELSVRVPVEVTGGDHYPDDWEGPRLVVHELEVDDVLVDAGWPTDRGRPADFSLERDSLRVVSQGVDDPTPLPTITWQGALLGDSGLGTTVTVAFLAGEDVDDYHIYFDRTEDGEEHDPVPRDPVARQRILQLLKGPGAGHELVAPVEANQAATVAVGSAHETSIRVEQITPTGATPATCSTTTVSPGTWATCTLDTAGNLHAVRVSADKPVAAYGWSQLTADGDGPGHNPLVALASAQGSPDGTELMAPDVRPEVTPVNLLALGDSCEASVGSKTVDVRSTAPSRVEIRENRIVRADCPMIGWIPGRGPATLPTAVNQTITQAGVTSTDHDKNPGADCEIEQRVTAVGDKAAGVTRIDTGQQEEDLRSLTRPNDAEPRHPGHAELGAGDWPPLASTEGTGYKVLAEDTFVWPAVWDPFEGARQLGPTKTGALGWTSSVGQGCADRPVQVQLTSVAFEGSARVSFAAQGERIAPSPADSGAIPTSAPITFTEEPAEATQVPRTGGVVETSLSGDLTLSAGFLLVEGSKYATGTSDRPSDDQIPATFASHLQPMDVEEREADIIGPLYDLTLEPSSRISPPGEVQTFDLVGQGLVRAPSGEVSPLTVTLNANTSTESPTAPSLEGDLGTVKAELPIDEAEPVTTFSVAVPSGIQPGTTPTYELTVTGEPQGGGDPVPARATLQVVPNREVSLVFEDGSQLADLSTDEGEAETTLLLSNEGTAVEDVELSTVVPGDLGWDVRLVDPVSGEPFPNNVVPGLEPSEEVPVDLQIEVPGDASRVVNVDVVAQSLDDASVTDEATARVAHGVDVNVDGSVDPDLVTLQPGSSQTVNLTLRNRGSEVSARINPDSQASLVLEAGEETVNLGPEGSERANATVPLNLTASSGAPLGSVLVGTIELQLNVGDLEPIQQLLSLRVRVVPEHGLEATEVLELLPGVEQRAELTVRATGDTDEDLALAPLSLPQGWRVEHPDRVRVPRNASVDLPLNITPPAGVEPDTYDLGFRGTPADGTDPVTFRAQAAVTETAAFNLTVPSPLPLGVGAEEAYDLRVENRGNAPGNTTIAAESEIVDATAQPAALQLAEGQSEVVDLVLEGLEPGNGTVRLDASPGVERTLDARVGTVDLGTEIVSTTPATPSEGERFRVVVNVANDGTVQARDVNVSLVSGDTELQSERVGRLDPGDDVSLTIGVNELASDDQLAVVADSGDRYEHADDGNREAGLSGEEAPAPAVLALLVALAAAAAVGGRS